MVICLQCLFGPWKFFNLCVVHVRGWLMYFLFFVYFFLKYSYTFVISPDMPLIISADMPLVISPNMWLIISLDMPFIYLPLYMIDYLSWYAIYLSPLIYDWLSTLICHLFISPNMWVIIYPDMPFIYLP